MISRFAAEIATACATAALGVVVVVGAREFGIGWDAAGPEPGAFPFYVGLIIIAGSLGTLAQLMLNPRVLNQPFIDRAQALRVAAFFGPMVLFVLVAIGLGLYVATALYLFGVMWIQGGYRAFVAAISGLLAAGIIYIVLEMFFKVPLLKGPLEAAMGLH